MKKGRIDMKMRHTLNPALENGRNDGGWTTDEVEMRGMVWRFILLVETEITSYIGVIVRPDKYKK